MTADSFSPAARRQVSAWLFIVTASIALMVVIGGITRLTESGLSIVEWKPVTGALPPIGEAAWQEEFAKYKESPQFRIRWPDMSLPEFKNIFWWEYLHRLWGRAIGFIFAVPFLYFLVRGMLPGCWKWKMGAAFILGGMQGFLGWFMVQSGLVDRPWVSAYRLTAHLSLALILMGYLFWQALNVARPGGEAVRVPGKWRQIGWLLFGLLALQICYGGFMAGLKAALAYPSFPTFNGAWWPSSWLQMDSWWRNWMENPAAVQIVHRLLGISLVVAFPLWIWSLCRNRIPSWLSRLGWTLPVLGGIQMLLGILTLVGSRGKIPVHGGVSHQAVAVLILLCLLALLNRTKRAS